MGYYDNNNIRIERIYGREHSYSVKWTCCVTGEKEKIFPVTNAHKETLIEVKKFVSSLLDSVSM